MARLRSPILWLIAAAAVLTVAWFIVTPRRAWHDFLRALAQKDPVLFSSVVDEPAMRLHAEEDLSTAINIRAGERVQVAPKLRQDLMQAMVDNLTSMPGLLDLVNGFSVPSGNGAPVRTVFRYHGLSQVDVLLGGTGTANTGAGLFTFERRGTHWWLVRASSQRVAALTNPGS